MAVGLGTSNISVVIPTTGERKVELDKVVGHLKDLGFEDILIVSGRKRLYERYLAVKKAKHQVIYTQDDDCIIKNIPSLIELYEDGKIIANTKLERLNWYSANTNGKVALVGWGALFDKSLVNNIQQYLNKFDEDELLYREADRVFTWVNKKKLVIADNQIEDFPTAMTGMSIEGDHFKSMFLMIERLKYI